MVKYIFGTAFYYYYLFYNYYTILKIYHHFFFWCINSLCCTEHSLHRTNGNFTATEIRCQEKSKGGLCYEVILAEPTVPKRAPSPPQQSPTQQTAIEDKLKAAEERRLSIEANKLAALTAKLSKIEEASRKKDELSAAFITATRESLDAKMNNTEEKREAHIAELKNKLKEHVSGDQRISSDRYLPF